MAQHCADWRRYIGDERGDTQSPVFGTPGKMRQGSGTSSEQCQKNAAVHKVSSRLQPTSET
jgi:hypothetical protein